MKLCRFLPRDDASPIANPVPCVGLFDGENEVVNLTAAGFPSLTALLELEDLPARLTEALNPDLSRLPLASVRLFAPVERHEVWAAGVTYLRSKMARMDESVFSASAYDRVYAAERPELFFKALAEKVVHPGEPVGVRRDARWTVPEPELALVFNSRGRLAGCTAGNDVSARDIEGENLLYLPQAKVYRRSCALGPVLTVGADETAIRAWQISLEIRRDGAVVFAGQTEVARLKRRFDELAEFLFRCQEFPAGAVLLTGTGIVPPDDFTLRPGDRVGITISGVGSLENPVVAV
jgi:2-dehydro-3-deoxy-D-arabinonate dehydratase